MPGYENIERLQFDITASDNASPAVDKAAKAFWRIQQTLRNTQSSFIALQNRVESYNRKSDEAEQRVMRMERELQRLNNIGMAGSQQWLRLADSIAQLRNKIADYGAQSENAQARSDALADRLAALHQEATNAGTALQTAISDHTSDAMQDTAAASEQTAEGLEDTEAAAEGAAASGSALGAALAVVANRLKNVNTNSAVLDKVGNMLNSTLNRIKNSLRRMLVISVIVKGIRNMITYVNNCAKGNKEFAKSVAAVKGNLYTAFAPIINNVIIPALTGLMQWLARVTGYIAQFITRLFGISAASAQAAAKKQNALQKDAKKTKKELKGQLASFDEINDISKKDSSSSSSGKTDDAIKPTYGTMEKMPSVLASIADGLKAIWTKAQPHLEKLKAAFGTLWTSIQGLFTRLSPYGATFTDMVSAVVNSVIDGCTWIVEKLTGVVDWVSSNIAAGTPIGNAIQWLINFITENAGTIVATVFGIWAAIKAIGFATKIASFVSTILTFISPHGLIIAAIIAAVALIILNWDKIKEGAIWLWEKLKSIFGAIRDFFVSVFKAIGEYFKNKFAPLFKLCWDAIVVVVDTVKGVFKGFFDVIAGLFTGDWERLWKGAANIFIAIWNGIVSCVEAAINFIIHSINVFTGSINKLLSGAASILRFFGLNVSISIPVIPDVKLGRVEYLASGGLVDAGQMFIANERGPEMVGTIGSHTAVANNDQIIAGIRQGVYEAMRSAMLDTDGGSRQTVIEGEMKVGETRFGQLVIKAIRSEERRTGNKYLAVNAT